MFTTEERIAVVSARLRGLRYDAVRADFTRRFRKPGPTNVTIRQLVNKFNRTGSVHDDTRSGRPSVPEGTVQRIQEAIERSPSASTRRLSRELELPQSTVWKILHFTLHKHAYCVQVVHHLEAEDYAARQAMCYDLIQAAENQNLMENILFSDEATFHTCGFVNKHNCRIWADEQPNATTEWTRNSPKVNVWLGLTQTKIYSPFMFQEPTITGTSYLDMLQMFLVPQLQQDGLIETIVFQQDGAPPHFANVVRDFLNETFPGRWVGRGSQRMWAPRSPDLTPLDFFAWGYVKSLVYRTKVRDLADLTNRIREAVDSITPNMLANVFRCALERLQLCFEMEGGHVELR